tara:strand:+ start:165 stop:527 length:363 start_codon:yes stop_codon:yes gene_type:complete
MAYNTTVKKLHDSSSVETVSVIYRTGFFDISNMDENVLIRRINLNYTSDAAITCYIYIDNSTTAVDGSGSFTFPANASGSKIVSRRPTTGIRAKTVSIRLQSDNVTDDITIRKLEIETDE